MYTLSAIKTSSGYKVYDLQGKEVDSKYYSYIRLDKKYYIAIVDNHLLEVHEYEKAEPINFGKLSVFPISLTHSIPDNVGYVLNTEDGAIVYTGNYVFDSSMQGCYKAL